MGTDHIDVSVSIRVLGDIAIEFDGVAVALPASLRAVALLGWLVTHAGRRTRSEIASALWPDVPDSSARRNVRTALWALRRALAPHDETVLDASRNRIGLQKVQVDFRLFDELVEAG
jgi:DNA-binding SARP family transcriptional activator